MGQRPWLWGGPSGLALIGLLASGPAARAQEGPRLVVPVPSAARLPIAGNSRPLGAAAAMQVPIDLSAHGYIEEELRVSGLANVYDWNAGGGVSVRHGGLPYATRILVRRPSDPARFSGTVLIDIGNRGAGFDTFAVWGQLGAHLLSRGHAYVAVTAFANNLGALRMFDEQRYGDLAYPPPPEACAQPRRDMWNRPARFFPPAEDAVRWDVISQVAALVKSPAASNPLNGYNVARVYASMQSGGDLPTYIRAFARVARLADGRRVYDAFLIKDSGGPRIALNDCAAPLAAGDPRRTIRDAGVPVMQILAQNAVSADIRRPGSDVPGDQFRQYELPGASHFDKWQYNYPATADLARAGVPPLTDHWTFPSVCTPFRAALNEFPSPYLFAGAFANLDAWVRTGVAPPQAQPIELQGNTVVADEFGNARGGVRTPWVDVPAATFYPEMGGQSGTPFRCDDNGYWSPFTWERLESVYGSSREFARRFAAAVDRLAAGRWVTAEDALKIKEEAARAASGVTASRLSERR